MKKNLLILMLITFLIVMLSTENILSQITFKTNFTFKLKTGLNVRENPNSQSKIIGKIFNTNVNIIEVYGDYVKIETDKGEGWVCVNYIEKKGKDYYIKSDVNIWNLPKQTNKERKIVGTYKKGEKINRIEAIDVSWGKIKFSEKKQDGWIYLRTK